MSPRPARWRPSPDDLRGLLLPVTAASCCWAARIERAAAHVPPVGHPTSHHVTGHKRRPAHRNKSGRPRVRTTQVDVLHARPTGWRRCSRAGGNGRLPGEEPTPGGPRRWPTAASQGCPEREEPRLPTAISAPKSSALQTGSSSSRRERPPARMPTTLRPRTGARALLGGKPPDPRPAKMPQKVLTSVPPQISYSPPLQGLIVGPELWLPAPDQPPTVQGTDPAAGEHGCLTPGRRRPFAPTIDRSSPRSRSSPGALKSTARPRA